MKRPLRVLVIEDAENDARSMIDELRKAGYDPEWRCVATAADLQEALSSECEWDVILCDFVMPAFDGLAALRLIHEREIEAPFIIVSRLPGEDIAVEAMRAGSRDFVRKNALERLVPIVERELREAETRRAQRSTEQTLRETQAQFRRLMETSADAIFRYEFVPRRRISYVNPAVVRHFGYSAEEIYADPDLPLKNVYADDRPQIEAILGRHELPAQPIVLRCWRKDGSLVWTEQRFVPIHDGSGQLIGFEGMARDITERHSSEEAIRQSEWRFRSVWENSADGMRLTDQEGIILAVNPAFCKSVGLPESELVGQPFTVAYAETDDRAGMLARYRQRFAERHFEAHAEHRVRDRSGRTMEMALSSSLVEMGNGQKALLSVFRDVTERKRAEAALRLNESRLEALATLNNMTGASLQQITDFALEEAVRLTGSTLGYLAFLNADESVLTMHSWSKTAMAECVLQDKQRIRPGAQMGSWGEAIRQRRPIIVNDHAAPNPLKKDRPPGQVEMRRHMNLPLFDGERIVAVAGVENKEEPYDESDVRQLTLLMQGMWRLLQRREAEQTLRENEMLLRSFFDSPGAQRGIIELAGEDILHISDNDVAAAFFGKPKEALRLQLSSALGVAPDVVRLWVEHCQEALRRNQPASFEYPHVQNQETRWFAATVTALGTASGPARFGYMVSDITERKRSEQELCRLNRQLRTSSACNQALVHAGEERQLLGEVCRILVEVGAYSRACVGLPEGNAALHLVAVAGNGCVPGSDDSAIRLADPTGAGPTAFRTGEVALAAGATSIGVPLMSEGKAVGVLVVATREAEGVGVSEIAWMVELARDLAFGLRALRDQEGRARAEHALREGESRIAASWAPSARIAIAPSVGKVDPPSKRVNSDFAPSFGP